MYTYVQDDTRQEILREREEKRPLALGEGGEGYIATDEWCYNCGGCGHLGDVSFNPPLASLSLTRGHVGLRRRASSSRLPQRVFRLQSLQHPFRPIRF